MRSTYRTAFTTARIPGVTGRPGPCLGFTTTGPMIAHCSSVTSLGYPAVSALQQNPDFDVFFGNSDEMAIGAALAAQQLGLEIGKDIFSVGIDGNDVTLDLIREGAVTATLGVYPRRMGSVVVEQMNKLLKGEDIPYILLTPSTVVDINDLDAYVAGEIWTDPVTGVPEIDNGHPTVP